MKLVALLALLAGCGAVTPAAGTDGGGVAPAEAGAHGDAVESECPPATLYCTGIVRAACPADQAMARATVCGGAPFAVCCPIADCELAACAPCPDCP